MASAIYEDTKVPARCKLAAMWTCVMFCYVYGDYFEPVSYTHLDVYKRQDPVNFGKSIQIGSESSRGLDVDVQWQLSPAWRMLASLNHQTPKNDDTGKQTLNVPKTSARLASHYQFGSRSIVPGLGVGVGLTHHSALPGDAANTFFTPSATVYDVQLSYAVGQARIGLSATNFSDKQYYVPCPLYPSRCV